MPGPRSIVHAFSLACASVLVTLVVIEGAFRLAHVSVGTVQINRETVRRVDNPLLRFDLRPGSVARAEVEYRVNGLGLRGPETTLAKPPGTRRVAVLGDSIAFGYWVSEKDAFPRQLETMLNHDAAGRVEVLDFGVPGYNLDQEVETLRTRALDFSPDAVVIAFCLNDLEGIFSYELGLVQDRAEAGRSLFGRAREALLRRSLLFSWIEYRLSELDARRRFVRARNPLGGLAYAEALGRERGLLETRFQALRTLLAPRGIPALVAVFPVFGGPFDRYPYGDLHGLVIKAAQAAGLAGVDLLDCYSAYGFRDLRVDVVHPNPMGHRIAAHAIRDALCARGWACDGAVPAGASCGAYQVSDFPKVRGY